MIRLAIGAVCAILLSTPRIATAQAASTPPASATPSVRVFLTCEGCDAALKAAVTFVEYVTDRQLATVEVAVDAQAIAGDTRAWRFSFAGRGPFASQDRLLSLSLPATATAEEIKTGLARVFKFGLVEYALRSESAPHLDVTFQTAESSLQASTGAGKPVRDPWNHWVFRIGANGSQYGERSQSSGYFSNSVSANRITEAWKLQLSEYQSRSTSRYMVSEDENVRTKQSDWSIDSLVVKSLDGHWSAGFTASASASTYSNQKLVQSFNPAVEYDIFPYAESSQRSLTIQYAVGVSRYKYREITIYDRLEETMPKHSVTASLGLRQPWGTAGGGATFSQSLNALHLNRLSLNGSISYRIVKGLSVSGSASFARIRDQFYLEKSDATEEEILLRLRQLATGHRVSASFGLSYSFGSLSNATVNPRFGF